MRLLSTCTFTSILDRPQTTLSAKSLLTQTDESFAANKGKEMEYWSLRKVSLTMHDINGVINVKTNKRISFRADTKNLN